MAGKRKAESQQSKLQFKVGDVLAYANNGELGVCQVTKDVPAKAKIVTCKTLEPSKTSILRYQVVAAGSIKVEDVLKVVEGTQEGNFYRISKKTKDMLDKLIPAESEEESSDTEEEESPERPVAMTQVQRLSATPVPKAVVAMTQLPQPQKRARPTQTNQTGKSTAKPKRGKPNPDIQVIDDVPELQDPSPALLQECCSLCVNRNIHRAVSTSNEKLLKNAFKTSKVLSHLSMFWGPDAKWTGLEKALTSGEKKTADLMLQGLRNEKFQLAEMPQCGITTTDTGNVGFEAFGVRVRAVQMSRGGKEGNNAFTYPLFLPGRNPILSSLKKFAKRRCENQIKILEGLYVSLQEFQGSFLTIIGDAVRAGNLPVAKWLMTLAGKQGGYGFNKLHEEVLSDAELSDFKKVSVTKKVIGNYNIAPLHCAAIHPNARHLQALLDVLDDVNYPDIDGRKTIHYAASNLSNECLTRLLAIGAKPNETDKWKITPLMVAAKYNAAESAETLLKAGAVIDAKNKKRKAAIHYAAKYECLEVMKVLIKYKSSKTIDMPGAKGMTPLIVAAASGNRPIVDFLLDNGAKVLKRDRLKRTALSMAVRNGQLSVASVLLARGADYSDPDSSKNYPLHYACAYGWPHCISLLVQAGADVNCMNDWRLSPLLVALMTGHIGCMRTMMGYPEVDVNCKDEEGRTLLSKAMDFLSEESLQEVNFLLRVKRADPNVPDLKGLTPVHHLARKSKPVYRVDQDYTEEKERVWVESVWELQIKALHLLIDNGADVNALTTNEETPITFAIRSRNRRICTELLKLGADLTKISKDNSGILHSVASLHEELHDVTQELLDRREVLDVCLNLVNDQGYTPLLLFMKQYKDQAEEVYQHILETVRKEERLKLTAELAQNPLATTTTGVSLTIDGMAGGLSGGARTRMTARPANSQFWLGQVPLGTTVPLALDEAKVLLIAKERFSDVVTQFMGLISGLIARGEEPNATVQKVKKYRDDPELIMKEWEIAEKSQPNLFTPNNTQTYFITDTEGNKLWNEYGTDGKSTCLHLAATRPMLPMIRYLLKEAEVDPNARNFEGATALAIAIRQMPEREVVSVMLDEGADPNICDCSGRTPILIATEHKSPSLLSELLSHHANPQVLSTSGDFPIKTAVSQKDHATLKLLLDSGADPNFSDHKKRTGLHYAFNCADTSANASFTMETLLLEAGADINALDIRDRSPLHYAFVKIGSPDDASGIDPIETVSSALGQKGVKLDLVDSWKRSPLHYAAQRGSVTSAMLLLSSGAALDSPDKDGNTPLCVSVLAKHPDFSITLIQKGASVHSVVQVVKHDRKKKARAQQMMALDDYNYNVYGQRNPALLPQAGANLPYGSFSLFRCAVKHQWQGVAYLLLYNGYDYMLAMQDSMVEGHFTLVLTLLSKVSDSAVLRKANEHGQNLFHALALYGAMAGEEVTNAIGAKLLLKKVDHNAGDETGCRPLHYACQTHFVHLISFLRNLKVPLEPQDGLKRTPLVYAIQGANVTSSLLTLQAMEGVSLNDPFETEAQVKTTPLIHAIDRDASKEVLLYLLEHKANVSDANSLGKTVLMHGICRNNTALVEMILGKVQVNAKDKKGRTAVHYTVRPFKTGSYENRAILEMLKKAGADLNVLDSKGRSPLHFADIQRSHYMWEQLLRLGAKPVAVSARRLSNYKALSPTDYTRDAETYIKQQRDLQTEIEELPSPDPVGGFREYFRLVPEFDLLMCRVDVNHGPYSAYLFYRMQLLEDTNRGVFVVFTRWGRIGENGANQRTPFPNIEEGVKEFGKIYKQKTGNEWGQPFLYVKGKYRLMEIKRKRVEFKNFLEGLDTKDVSAAQSPPEVLDAMKHMSDIGIYKYVFATGAIDQSVLNFSNISLKSLSEAEDILKELGRLIPVLTNSKDTATLLETKDRISDLSSRFYEIIPLTTFLHSTVPPIQHPNSLKQVTDLLDSLKNVELASQIILGALLRRSEMHPLDYCYFSLRCEMKPLSKDSDEYRMVELYARQGNCANKIEAVMSISREDEGKKCEKWANQRHRMLLWHGSSIFNFFGILRNGLKIAPPEAPTTGYMFGKGVYFADTFSKSFQYTGGIFEHAYMLLCEVVLGNMQVKYNAEYVEKLPQDFLSTKGCGRFGPDPAGSVVLNTGAIVPLGPIVEYPLPDNEAHTYFLHQNEYIVYDESQVRLRYLLQVDSKAQV